MLGPETQFSFELLLAHSSIGVFIELFEDNLDFGVLVLGTNDSNQFAKFQEGKASSLVLIEILEDVVDVQLVRLDDFPQLGDELARFIIDVLEAVVAEHPLELLERDGFVLVLVEFLEDAIGLVVSDPRVQLVQEIVELFWVKAPFGVLVSRPENLDEIESLRLD